MARPASTAAAQTPAPDAPVPIGRARAEALVQSYRRLAEVFHEVLSEQELGPLLDRIADTLSELMPYEALHIYEADEARRELVPVHARSSHYEAEIMRSRPRFGEGLTGWAVEHRSPVWTNRAHLDSRVVNVPGTPVEPEAMITVPLIARGALKGALNIYRIGEQAEFLEHEFELAKWFGDAAALALDNAQIRARLEHAAQTDSLTGLYNHRYFHERLRAELTRASRAHDSVALLMFDIDDFKRVNDVYGHGAGDQLLIHLTRIARESVRASDVVCRLGGEEFGVIMPSCHAADALGLAARLQERLRETEIDPTGTVTVSVGIAQGPEHAMNPRELVTCAEAAMMTAKAHGKNGVVLFDDDRETVRPAARDGERARDVRSLAHMKMLQSLAGKLNRLIDVSQIADTIATELRLLIDYHNCRVFLREGEELRPIAFVGHLDERAGRASEAYSTRVGVGITGRVVATGESLLVPNAIACEFAVRIAGTEELDESLAAVPLRYGSRVTGAIVISKLGLDQFDEHDVRLLEVLAAQASIALENARLYEGQRREAENARALLRFAEAASKAHAQDEIAHETVTSAARLLARAQASLWLADEEGARFTCVASHGYRETIGGRASTDVVLDSEDVHRFLGGQLEPFYLTRDETLERLPQFSVDPAWLGVLVAPLLEGDGVAGWLVVRHSAGEPGPPTGEDEHRLAAGLASQASVALRKARLYARQREAAEVASALLDASRQLATAEGSEEVLARIVDVTGGVLAAQEVTLWLQAEETPHALERYAATAHAPRRSNSYSANLVHPWLERMEPFVVTTAELARIGVEPARAGRFAVAPIRVDGNRLGGLVVEIGARAFGDRQLKLLAGLAHQAKLALENAAHFERLERTFVSTVEALANALEAKDEYTSSHARWITDMALLVGRALELDRDALKRLELGALFHDIGKIGIPSAILRKPGPLTDDEFQIVKEHPEVGEKILAPIERLADVRPIVRACHERWDGGGYPDGKAGAEIPIEARIVLVCDAFHAMTTDRPYRGRLDVGVAVARLRESAGSQFDPHVVEAFGRLFDGGAVLPLG